MFALGKPSIAFYPFISAFYQFISEHKFSNGKNNLLLFFKIIFACCIKYYTRAPIQNNGVSKQGPTIQTDDAIKMQFLLRTWYLKA